jgi:hypothetical protein
VRRQRDNLELSAQLPEPSRDQFSTERFTPKEQQVVTLGRFSDSQIAGQQLAELRAQR